MMRKLSFRNVGKEVQEDGKTSCPGSFLEKIHRW